MTNSVTITDADIDAFLEQSGLAPPTDAPPGSVTRLREDLRVQLAALATVAPPEEQGGTKIVVGNLSLRVGGTLWPLALAVVKLFVASHDPSGITWHDAAGTAVDALKALYDVADRLDPTERRVCTAVAEKRREHVALGWEVTGANRADIVDHFAAGGFEAPRALDGILEALSKKHVLTASEDPARGLVYRIAF